LYGNSPAAVAVAGGLFFVAIIALLAAKRILIGRLERNAATGHRNRDGSLAAMLRKTRFIFLLFIALGLASVTLAMPSSIRTIVVAIAKIALLIQIALWGVELISVLFKRYLARGGAEASSTAEGISYVARGVLWLLIILVGLESFGIHVTALVAGLGIGGIAVALAVQNILGDIFAALSILFDKPFVLGDLIEVGEYAGTVSHIGIKSTRIRSVTGEQIILANGELLKRGIRNFERTGQRRAVLLTRIGADVPEEKIRSVPEIIKRAVESEPAVRFEQSHLTSVGSDGYQFETVYYAKTSAPHAYLDSAQSVNFALLRELRAAGIPLLSQKAGGATFPATQSGD
jgi:small-conductance mechanosensitive channel